MEIKTIENQYKEDIPETFLRYDSKREVFILSELNCHSSQSMGLGTCRCISHPTYNNSVISRNDAIDLINNANLSAINGLSTEEHNALTDESIKTCLQERFVLAGFDTEGELCSAIEAAYKLGLNPLPKVREMLSGLPVTVNFAYDDDRQSSFFSAGPRLAVFGVFLADDFVRTELFDTYYDNQWFKVMENEDITC